MCWLQKILPLPLPVKEVLCPNEVLKEKQRIEKAYEYVAVGGYPRMSRDGKQLELVYEYKESRYIGEGGYKIVEQNWRYYSWNKIFKFWQREGGHTQISDELSYELMKSKKEVDVEA